MVHKNEALEFDLHDKPVQAVRAYRLAIVRGDADPDTYINCAVLLFECHDYGYASYHWLPDDFRETALGRAHELLDQAEFRFRSLPEILFWRNYFKLIYQGGSEFHAEAEKMVARGTAVPYFYLISGPSADAFKSRAQELLAAVKDGRTAKERYIKGVLESHIHDKLLRSD